MAPYCTRLDACPAQSSASSTSSDSTWDDIAPERPLPPITVPECLPLEHSLSQLLTKVSGTEKLETVTSIKLKVIAEETSLQRLGVYMPALCELDLTGSYLQSLRNLGCGLTSLKILRVDRCHLDSLDGVFGVVNLEELYATDNNIRDVGYCASLPYLRLLDLRKNPITNLRQIEFLNLCTELKELMLEDCPVTNVDDYRLAVRKYLPKLKTLDGSLLIVTGPEKCSIHRHDDDDDDYDSDDEDDESQDISVEQTETDNAFTESKKQLPELFQKSVNIMPFIKKERPATSHVSSRSISETMKTKIRPSTGVYRKPSLEADHIAVCNRPHITVNGKVKKGAFFIDTPVPEQIKEPVSDEPSKLTSGGIVCGNLAAALRAQRKNKKAWQPSILNGENTKHKELSLLAIKDEIIRENGYLGSHKPPEETMSDTVLLDAPTLLDASRRWREAYNSFRSEHSEKWKLEEDEASDMT